MIQYTKKNNTYTYTQDFIMKSRFPFQRKLLYFYLNQYFIFQMKMALLTGVF